MGEQNFHLRKIDGDIVNVNWIPVAIAGAVKNRCAGVEHDRNSIGLGGPVDDFEFGHAILVVVGKQKLVGRVNLDHADLKPQNVLDIGQNILAVTRVQTRRMKLNV